MRSPLGHLITVLVLNTLTTALTRLMTDRCAQPSSCRFRTLLHPISSSPTARAYLRFSSTRCCPELSQATASRLGARSLVSAAPPMVRSRPSML